MPRTMPNLVAGLSQKIDQAVDLAGKIEAARLILPKAARHSMLHHERLEIVYEMAFFRIYLAWEEFLEQTFVRYLAGYTSSVYTPQLVGAAPASLQAAWAQYLGGQNYKLWHDPARVVQRAQGFLVNSPHETVVNSALSDLKHYAAIRHRIAHAQDHARAEFDSACVSLIGHHVRASKAGKLLRQAPSSSSGVSVSPGDRWLHKIADDYKALATQIA